MNETIASRRGVPRAVLLTALTAGIFVAMLVFQTGIAHAAYTAAVQKGTLEITGNGASDKLAFGLASPSTLFVDVGEDGTTDFTFDRGTFSAIDVQAGGGDDEVRVVQLGGALTDIPITIDGGPGNDTLIGGDGAEVLNGGPGNDFVDGNRGNDTADLGPGDDTFQWDPGDGSDTVEGGGGHDTLAFNGSNANEKIDLNANGSRFRLARDVGGVVMDTNSIETVNVRALGGTDNVTVGDLTGTDVNTVNVDLAGNSNTPDGTPDTITVDGTSRRDRVDVSRFGSTISVAGLQAETNIFGSDPTLDTLQIQTFEGTDDVTVAQDVADLIVPVIDLGADQ